MRRARSRCRPRWHGIRLPHGARRPGSLRRWTTRRPITSRPTASPSGCSSARDGPSGSSTTAAARSCCPPTPATRRDAALAGVTTEPLDDATLVQIRGEIQGGNMDAVPLEKAPKVAVYAPPNAAPWDDAVTMALNYAGIEFEKIWDPEVVGQELKTYDWLHLHHEDFTGQYSKFFLNYAGAPWLVEMVERNRAMARTLGFPSVPAEKRAVATAIARVRRARRIPLRDVHRDGDAGPGARRGRGGHRGGLRRRHAHGSRRHLADAVGPRPRVPGRPARAEPDHRRSTPTSTATRSTRRTGGSRSARSRCSTSAPRSIRSPRCWCRTIAR